jgi:membrane-bound lytic murein transglycosylase D
MLLYEKIWERMTTRRIIKILPSTSLVLVLMLLVSCETGKKKVILAQPPVAQPPQPAPPEPVLPLPPPPSGTLLELYLAKTHFNFPDELIRRSEAKFLEGERNLKAGFTGRAKRDFDESLDILLRSGLLIGEEEKLEKQYESLIDRIFAYELNALKEGDGFREEQVEAAPIDEIIVGEIPQDIDPRVRQLAEEVVRKTPRDIPLALNDTVLRFIHYFMKRGRKSLEVGMQRAGRYRPMIARILAEEGAPQDLIYLCQAESGYRPLALSRAKCKGLWQFAVSRGKEYGLRQNWWIDERSDPGKSTRAAARHLKDLHAQFGDWLLAMAAYNTGPGNVERAVARTGYANYWELVRRGTLHPQTVDYIPIIIAIAIISKDPGRFGFEVAPDPPLEFEAVPLSSPIDLRLVAESCDLNLALVQELNPHVRRLTTPRNDPEFRLYLPRGIKNSFFEQIASIPEERRVSWRLHRVEEGEMLATIASKYRTTASAIAEANNLQASEKLRIGEKLIIPVTARKGGPTAVAGDSSRIRYTVQRGDTVAGVAREFGVTITQLRKWNGLRSSSKLTVGQVLTLYAGEVPQPAPKASPKVASATAKKGTITPKTPAGTEKQQTRVVHKVKKGDNLSSIASSYKTTVAALRQWNNLPVRYTLRIGDQLTIFTTR